LFEPINPFTLVLLQNAIKETINNFESRVRLVDVTVSSDLDNNGFNVRLQYIILNRNLPVDTTLFLERIR
jgi:phage baseplate assembly protein W